MTLQQATERRPKKIDLNILPAEYRPPKKSHLSPVLYLIVFILICAMAVVIVVKSGVDSDIDSLDQNLSNLIQQLTQLQANKAEADPLKAQIAGAQEQLANLEADYEEFIDSRLIWSEIIDQITEMIPGTRLTVKTISTSIDKVTLSGSSTKRTYVYEYALDLEESDLFDGVSFTFGDCPETSNCDFTITAPFELNQDSGGN